MVGPDNKRQLIIEYGLLLHIIDWRRVTQSSDKDVNLAIAKAMQKIFITPVNHTDFHIRAQAGNMGNGGGKNVSARKRHCPDNDPAAVNAFI